MSLSRMPVYYGIVRSVYGSRLKQLWNYLRECSIDRRFANEKTRSVDTIFQIWHAYRGGQNFQKPFLLVCRWVLVRLVRFLLCSSSCQLMVWCLLAAYWHSCHLRYRGNSPLSLGETVKFCSIAKTRIHPQLGYHWVHQSWAAIMRHLPGVVLQVDEQPWILIQIIVGTIVRAFSLHWQGLKVHRGRSDRYGR